MFLSEKKTSLKMGSVAGFQEIIEQALPVAIGCFYIEFWILCRVVFLSYFDSFKAIFKPI